MTFETTDPQLIDVRGYRPHLMSANGGDITLEKQLEDGTWVEVSGSPILDGEEVTVTTKSSGDQLRATPSAIGTQLSYGSITYAP